MKIDAVLFDLDGTLLDTATDIAAAVNRLRHEHGMHDLAVHTIRDVVSFGAPKYLKLAFGIDKDHPDFEERREQLLNHYAENIAVHTKYFPGILEVLTHLESNALPWGIVTNKPGHLTDKLAAEIKLHDRADCIISPDTLGIGKPNPKPLLHACKLINCKPENTLYIGDAKNDILAANAANMPSVLALYGYIPKNAHPATWGAKHQIDQAKDILQLL